MEQMIAVRRQALDGLEVACALYRQTFSSTMATPAARPRAKAQARVAAGSLADRILSIAVEPVTLVTIVDGAGARKADVKREVKQLMADKRLSLTGHSRGARYQVR